MDYATRKLRPFQGSSWVISLRIPVQTGCGTSLLNAGVWWRNGWAWFTFAECRERYPRRSVALPVSRAAV